METPKFIKKLAKGATIATIGLLSVLPNESKGQEVKNISPNEPNKRNIENVIETSEQLNQQIFKEIEKGFQNGVLENLPENPFYYHKESGKYKISYNLDINQDGKKEENPQISIDCEDGNLNFSLVKKSKTEQIKDLVFNYKDKSLTDSDTDTYENFFAKNGVVILSLRGDKTHPIDFRKISDTEKKQILFDLKTILGKEDSITVQKNIENIKEFENKKEIENHKKTLEKEVVFSAKKLLDILKKTEASASQDGLYTYKFDHGFKISFTDQRGNQSEVLFDTNPEFKLNKVRKIIMKNLEPVSIEDLSILEIKNIIENALFKSNN